MYPVCEKESEIAPVDYLSPSLQLPTTSPPFQKFKLRAGLPVLPGGPPIATLATPAPFLCCQGSTPLGL